MARRFTVGWMCGWVGGKTVHSRVDVWVGRWQGEGGSQWDGWVEGKTVHNRGWVGRG